MTDKFVAEIRIFPFNFAPTGWAHCDGQLMPISQNTALFSLLSTTYGGDGKSTFALPDLQGQAPMQPDQGPGLSQYFLGETGGTESVTLLNTEMPSHSHQLQANANPSNLAAPTPLRSLARSSPGNAYSTSAASLVQMSLQALGVAGASLPHNNMQPYLTLNFCIALQGIFPTAVVSLGARLRRRQIADGDMPFLLALYATTRQDEMDIVPWTDEQKAAFVQMQFMAQHTDYTRNYPDAAFDLVLLDDEPVGRVYVHEREEEIRILDIALAPSMRNQGIGSVLLNEVLARAREAGKPVTLHVEANNPAQRLYARLGFRFVQDAGFYQMLRWDPA